MKSGRNSRYFAAWNSFYWFLIENCHVMFKLDNRRFCHIRCKYVQRQKRQDKRFILDLGNKTTFVPSMAVFGWVTHLFQSTVCGGSAEQPTLSTRPEKHRRRICTNSQSQIWEHSTGIQRRTQSSTKQLAADQTGTKCGPQWFQFPSPCF